jgi:hypothetical protein
MSTAEKHEQHMVALERANRIRLARAAVKRKVYAGDIDLADLIRPDAEISECLRSAPIGTFLTYQRRWGGERARKLLASIGIGWGRRLDALTDRERRVLTARLLGVSEDQIAVAA